MQAEVLIQNMGSDNSELLQWTDFDTTSFFSDLHIHYKLYILTKNMIQRKLLYILLIVYYIF